MAFRYASFVRETSSTTGTGTYSLNGAAAGYRTFAAGIGSGNTCPYAAGDGTDWEVGIGTVTAGAPDTLARTTVLASSSGSAAIAWSSGARTLVCAPLGELADRLADGSAAAPGLAFAEDPDTGLFRIGADHLGVAVAGMLAARFDASGRFAIGVGTGTALTDPLTVEGGTLRLRAGGSLGNTYLQAAFQLGGSIAEAGQTHDTSTAKLAELQGRAVLCVVSGRDQLGAGGKLFSDVVFAGIGMGTPEVVRSLTGGSGPAARIYSNSGTELRLSMGTADGGYRVAVSMLSASAG